MESDFTYQTEHTETQRNFSRKIFLLYIVASALEMLELKIKFRGFPLFRVILNIQSFNESIPNRNFQYRYPRCVIKGESLPRIHATRQANVLLVTKAEDTKYAGGFVRSPGRCNNTGFKNHFAGQLEHLISCILQVD